MLSRIINRTYNCPIHQLHHSLQRRQLGAVHEVGENYYFEESDRALAYYPLLSANQGQYRHGVENSPYSSPGTLFTYTWRK